MEYDHVDSSIYPCELEEYYINAIFYEDPMSKSDRLKHSLKLKSTEVNYMYYGNAKKFTLVSRKRTLAEYYLDLDNEIDSIVVYKYPIDIGKDEISNYRATYMYDDSRLKHATSIITYMRDDNEIELRYELNKLDNYMNGDQYLLLNSDGKYLPTTFTFEKAWRSRKR